MTARTVDLIESGTPGAALTEARVDDGILKDAVLLANRDGGRLYEAHALDDAARLFVGGTVFLDHAPKTESRDRGGVRSVHDIAGRVTRARVSKGKVVGDVELLDHEPSRSLMEALARQAPGAASLGFRGRGEVRVEDGVEVVETVTRVDGIDVTTRASSTEQAGIFESVCRGCNAEEMVRRAEGDLIREGYCIEISPGAHRILQEAAKQGRLQEVEADVRRLLRRDGGGGSGGSRLPTQPRLPERDPDDDLRIRGNGSGPSEADVILMAEDAFIGG